MCPPYKDGAKTAQKPPPGTRKARKARGRGSFSPCETPLLELLPTGQARQRVARKKAPAEVTGAFFAGLLDVWRAYRCRTRSRISSVRPWFQNWVPM